jgi:Questin oxidase-like
MLKTKHIVKQGSAWTALNRLLAEGHQRFHIEYGPGFSNHLSHQLCSLYKLGATETRLQQCFDSFAGFLQPLPDITVEISEGNYMAFMGRGE